MSFKKLALVTAMFAATSGAYAMEAMDDESLAAATGQDGITVAISTNALTLNQIIHDRDGATGIDINGDGTLGDVTNSGALTIDNMVIDTLGGEIVLKIDADGNAAGNAFLNINVNLSAGLQIQTGDLSVGDSLNVLSAAPTTGEAQVVTWGGVGEKSGVIMESQTITLGATTLNIQLGNEVQSYLWDADSDPLTADVSKTAMILLQDVTMTNGLTIGTWDAINGYTGGLTLNDANGGSISIGRMSLKDYNAPVAPATEGTVGANLSIGSVGINVENNGLVVDVVSIGGTAGLYQSMERVALGATGSPSLGDIEVTGLQLNGTSIRISGH